jgi:hypothetical protein
MKKTYGCIALFIGLGLLWLPFQLLRFSSNAPGDGGPNFIPGIQALASLVDSLIAFASTWFFLKRGFN